MYTVSTVDNIDFDDIQANSDAQALAIARRKFCGEVKVRPVDGVFDGTLDLPFLTQEDIRFKAIVGDCNELSDQQINDGVTYWFTVSELLEQAGPVFELARCEALRVGDLLSKAQSARRK